jgi:hypothetical protein
MTDKPTTLRALYRTLSTRALVALREAFTLDARETDSPICRAFCEARLALIGAVLRERLALERKRKAARAAPAGGEASGETGGEAGDA